MEETYLKEFEGMTTIREVMTPTTEITTNENIKDVKPTVFIPAKTTIVSIIKINTPTFQEVHFAKI